MSVKRYQPVDSEKAARAKEKRQRRKPVAEDDTPVEPIVIKSPSRRYETPDTRPNSQSLANRPPEYGGGGGEP